jgi:hypothetical protein
VEQLNSHKRNILQADNHWLIRDFCSVGRQVFSLFFAKKMLFPVCGNCNIERLDESKCPLSA